MNLLTNSIYQFQFINLIVHSSIQPFTNSSINQSNSSAIHQSNSSSNHQFTNSLLHLFINSSFNQFISNSSSIHQSNINSPVHQIINSSIHPPFIHPEGLLVYIFPWKWIQKVYNCCCFNQSFTNATTRKLLVKIVESYMQSLQQQKVNKVV